jgi:hypothetical protein
MNFPGGFELIFGLLVLLGLGAAVWFIVYTAVRAGNRRR